MGNVYVEVGDYQINTEQILYFDWEAGLVRFRGEEHLALSEEDTKALRLRIT